jgi:hypothetical protein
VRFLVPVPTVPTLAGLSVLFVNNLLRLDRHVNDIGSIGLEATVYRKSVQKAQTGNDGNAARRQRCSQLEGRSTADKPLHEAVEDEDRSTCLPLSGDLSSNMRPKCISRIELGDVGRVSHSVSGTVSQTFISVGRRGKQPGFFCGAAPGRLGSFSRPVQVQPEVWR